MPSTQSISMNAAATTLQKHGDSPCMGHVWQLRTWANGSQDCIPLKRAVEWHAMPANQT